jgi:ABC-type antimicrobial peptide transport system permease subunit
VRSVDRNLPLFRVQSQEEQIAASLQRERLLATLASWLGAVTVALSAIGLYALLAYAVTRRTGEIGIRMTLGAQRSDVRWMIVRQSLVLAAWGLAFGVAASAVGTKMLETLLFNVAARDPLTVALAAAIMLTVCAVAGYLPARRASRVDPMVALRAE